MEISIVTIDKFDLMLAAAAVLYIFRASRPWRRRRKERRIEEEQATAEASWRSITADDDERDS